MLSGSIHQAERVHDGVDPIEAHADRYFAEIGKGELGKESKRMTKTTGVFVPLKWAERWDFTTAAYLSHFVHYLGTQRSKDGYIWDSEKEVQAKTGITANQQRRCRRILAGDHALHMKKRGIGNKWNIRPNVPLLKLFDDVPSWDEAVGKVRAEMGHDPQPEKVGASVEPLREKHKSEAEVNSVEKHESFREYHEPFRAFQQTHNSNSAVTHSNSLSGAHARPEPETKREEKEEVSPKVAKSVEVLSTIEGLNVEPRMLERLVTNLVEKHPRITDPVKCCEDYRDKVATRHIDKHASYLAGHFEREAARIESQPSNPHGPEAERLKDKPNRADWYEAAHGADFEEVERMIRGELTHTEIMEAIERKEVAA